MKREVNSRRPDMKRERYSEPAQMKADSKINTDPEGMWTGISTEDPMEEPIQDADDL